jgi:hypothetical protein
MRNSFILLAAAAVALPAAGADTSVAEQKKQYHLFNPTPRELMREMSTDRPDKTESPYTVDAGHFQIESDVGVFDHDHDTGGGADVRGETWSFATLNLKAGLCNFSDLQLVLNPYVRAKSEDFGPGGGVTRADGFGDLVARLKVNLWGNDGGACAGALMPFAKIPTASRGLGNDAVEGGLIIPVGVDIGGGFSLGAMTEVDWAKDGAGSDYHPELINSITLGRNIFGDLNGYVEFWSWASSENGATPWMGTVDLGLTYGLTENIQLDAGINIGVTKSAPDWNPFIGLAIRF